MPPPFLSPPKPIFFQREKPPHTVHKNMAPTNSLTPSPRGPSHIKRISGWLSRHLRRTNKRQTTKSVEVQQPLSEESTSVIDLSGNTTITPSNQSRRHPSLWRRVFRRRRALGGRITVEFDQVEPQQGFSPPRHRQPEWMRRWRADEGRASESKN